MRHTLRTVCIFAVMISTAACAPKIISFQASPGRICKGQSTIVSWQVKGNAVLLADPPTAGTGAAPSSGSQHFTLSETTLFTIKATRNGEEKYANLGVDTFTIGDTKEIIIETRPDGAGGLIAVETPRPEVWDSIIRIDTISGQSNRTLRILHEGREVILSADGSTSDRMRGTKVSGRWEIHAELLPGEVMGDPAHAPPDILSVLLRLSCLNGGK